MYILTNKSTQFVQWSQWGSQVLPEVIILLNVHFIRVDQVSGLEFSKSFLRFLKVFVEMMEMWFDVFQATVSLYSVI